MCHDLLSDFRSTEMGAHARPLAESREYEFTEKRTFLDVAMAGVLESPTRIEPHPSVRTLKIEADGDLWKGLIKPKTASWGAGLNRRVSARVSASRSRALLPGSSSYALLTLRS